MAKLYNRAWVNTTTAGTGTVTLGTARTGYFTFAEAGVQNGDVVSYVIEDGDDVEFGIGTYTSAGTTLSRDTVTASKIAGVVGTSKISLSGNATVFITARKEDLLSVSETQSANTVFAGPSSGGAAVPAFRAIVVADFGTQVANTVLAGPSSGADAKPTFRAAVYLDTAPAHRGISTQTGSYTAVLADAGKTVEMNVASANNFTIPPNSSVAFATGDWINVTQIGAGQTTIVAGVGVTLRNRNGLKLTGQYAVATLYKRGTDEWVVGGDLVT